MGAKTKVPTPDPVTQRPGEGEVFGNGILFDHFFFRPVAKESRREKY